MAYNELTQYNSPNYTPAAQVPAMYGMSRTVDGITYHWWGDPANKPQFHNIISWLCRANGNTSAHTVGEAGRVAWIVNAWDAAWHAGNSRGNAKTVGYECNPRLSDGDYETMGEFHYDMEKAYGKRLAIYVHKEWTPTSCSPIDKNRIRQIADRYHKGVPAKKNATADEVKQAYLDILKRPADAGGLKTYTTNGMSIAEVRADLMKSKERKDLEAREAAEYAKKEWVRNLKDITDVKLTVLPANGAKVINLETGKPVNDTIIPRGTNIDIAKETTVKGVRYYISSWSAARNIANGIPATNMGVPAEPPVQEKPDWFKNLKDVEDSTMYTRSEAPILNLTDGSTAKKLPINTPVEVSMSTEIVGNKLMIVKGTEKEGKYQGIELIYLSNTPINKPYEDLEKRLTVLEKIVKSITDFLDKIFKQWR